MKSLQLDLEDFGSPAPEVESEPSVQVGMPTQAVDLDALKMEAYESGYKTGWDDATKSCEEQGKLVSEELARNLKDLDFTYFEAQEEVSNSMKAFLLELFADLFPAMLPDSVASVVEDIVNQSKPATDSQLEILVSPDDATIVQSLMNNLGEINANLVEEPALATGQSKVRIDSSSYEIDAARTISKVREIAASSTVQEKIVVNG